MLLNPACIASKHAVVPHNTINYYERLNWCFQRNRDERYVHIPIIRFTLTLSSASSLASIHNHGVSNRSLLADPFFFVCNRAYGRYYEIWMCAGNEKNLPFAVFCWVNTYCSLNQVKLSQITGDPCALDIPDGATASTNAEQTRRCTGVGKQTHVHVSCLHDKTTARNNRRSKPQSPRQSKQLSFV